MGTEPSPLQWKQGPLDHKGSPRSLLLYTDQKSDAHQLSFIGPNFIAGKRHRRDAGLEEITDQQRK